ncbi:MAG: biotin--[acetyl-CoA-carboxylase] ligase [Pseudomonadota bacterium]
MNATLLAVLRLLSRDAFLSGEQIARQVGCSRATVHNLVRQAPDLGVEVHAVQGRGYRLARPLNWLDPAGLASGLAALGFSHRHLDQVGSTNAWLLEAAQGGAPHRTVVTTDWQTHGRGRRGRTWQGGLGQGLTFSLLWRSGRPLAELSGLSLAVGVMLAEALQAMGLEQARVKWPNDLVVGDAKLAGVLIELSGDMLGPSAAVIGIGLNLRGGDALSKALGQPVTDLGAYLGEGVDGNAVLLALMAALDRGLTRFEQAGFAAFHAAWDACHAYRGRQVTLHPAQGAGITGEVLGVDEHGALRLLTAEGERRFHSGEVSLRGALP